MLKFFWNGIKDNGGKLQTCHYSASQLIGHPTGTITIYKREYSAFSTGVSAAFAVQDDTDLVTDYICREHIRVAPDHPLYVQVHEACLQEEEHHAASARKRALKWLAAHAYTHPLCAAPRNPEDEYTDQDGDTQPLP